MKTAKEKDKKLHDILRTFREISNAVKSALQNQKKRF